VTFFKATTIVALIEETNAKSLKMFMELIEIFPRKVLIDPAFTLQEIDKS